MQKWGVREHQMGKQVTQERMDKVYGEAIMKRIQIGMKQKERIRNNGCDVLCICVGIGDVLLAMAMGSDDECRKTTVRRAMRNTMRIR